MNARIPLPSGTTSVATADPDASLLLEDSTDGVLDRLLLKPAGTAAQRDGPGSVVVAELLALTDNGNTPLVALPGADGSAVAALTVVDLHGGHIGMQVIVAFESGGGQPIVLGLVRGRPGWPLESKPAQVDVDVDGQRLVVSAKEQLVLRCGKASITLTKAGKVLIEGSYVLSRSSGVNRIKGGSVQMN